MALNTYENFQTKGAKSMIFSLHSQLSESPSNFKERHSILERFSSKIIIIFHSTQETMASTSGSGSKKKKGSEMLVKGVEWKAPNFKLVPAIAEPLDSQGAQSQIPPKVLMINDIRTHFKCTIQEIGTLEM